MTEEQQHQRAVEFIKDEVRRLQRRLHLEDLDFNFVFVQAANIEIQPCADYTREIFARVIPDFRNHSVFVEIATLRPLREIRSTLRHELLHVVVEPLHSYVYRMIGRLPKGQRAIVAEEWEERLEQAVSDLERVVGGA